VFHEQLGVKIPVMTRDRRASVMHQCAAWWTAMRDESFQVFPMSFEDDSMVADAV
jgi:hypothetical protein